jgi:hypothetical protein
MAKPLRISACACLAVIAIGCAAPPPVSPQADAEPRSFDYMAALRKAEADVSAAGNDEALRISALQALSTEQSFVGATADAHDSLPFGRMTGPASQADEAAARELLAEHEPRDALGAIVAAARGRQIVILNEAHHVPRHRAFATRVMLELRKLGFEYFAAETLDERTDALAARGYLLISDGYYSREPLFGDLLRQALAVGYRPVAYEFLPDAQSIAGTDWIARIALREQGQARNLVDRVLAKDPKARIFIYVGYSHALEIPEDAGDGRTNTWMAARLREMTGIDPLSIDQATFRPVMGPLRDSVFGTIAGDSVVLVSRADPAHFWTAPNGVDMTVLHRAERDLHGRPDWLEMSGYRKPRAIPAKLLPKTGRRLIQAFVAGESTDAVPVDQLLVTAGQPVPVLMLPKGKYRFAFQD